MSNTLPESTNIYNRVDSNNLLADTNLVKRGSITTDVISPSDWNLWSRTGGDLDTARSPIPGYCLHFSQANQLAYIQTAIPSSERDNYDIVIKGEGNTEILVVDSSKENIAIKQGFALSISPSAYFDLSYIAFINRITGKLDHLFECEEGSSTSTILYDAVTGNTATINNATSLSALRVSKQTKEFIKDLDHVKDELRLTGNTLYSKYYKVKTANNTNLPELNRSELTLAITFKKDEKVTEQFLFSIGEGTRSNTTTGLGFATSLISAGQIRIRLNYMDNTGSVVNAFFDIPTSKVPLNNIYDGNWHKLIVIFNNSLEKGFKVFFDSSTEIDPSSLIFKDNSNNIITPDFTGGYINPKQICLGKNPSAGVDAEQGGWNGYVKNPKIFNFDITKEGSLYTAADYINEKDLPNTLLNTEIETKSSITKPGTPVKGTVTQDGNTFTFDGYSTDQWEMSLRNLHITPGSWMTFKLKVDGYTTKVTTDATEIVQIWSSSGAQVRLNSLDATANLNRAMYACCDKYQYTVFEEDGTTVVYASPETTLTTPNMPPLPNILLRPVDAYETSRPRILVYKLRLAEDLIKDTFGRFPYINIAPTINTYGNTFRYTGTIEFLGANNDTCIFNGGNLSQSTMQWLDKSFNTNNLTFSLSNTKLNSDSKCYGTFANAYGYTNASGVIIPRKIN